MAGADDEVVFEVVEDDEIVPLAPAPLPRSVYQSIGDQGKGTPAGGRGAVRDSSPFHKTSGRAGPTVSHRKFTAGVMVTVTLVLLAAWSALSGWMTPATHSAPPTVTQVPVNPEPPHPAMPRIMPNESHAAPRYPGASPPDDFESIREANRLVNGRPPATGRLPGTPDNWILFVSPEKDFGVMGEPVYIANDYNFGTPTNPLKGHVFRQEKPGRISKFAVGYTNVIIANGDYSPLATHIPTFFSNGEVPARNEFNLFTSPGSTFSWRIIMKRSGVTIESRCFLRGQRFYRVESLTESTPEGDAVADAFHSTFQFMAMPPRDPVASVPPMTLGNPNQYRNLNLAPPSPALSDPYPPTYTRPAFPPSSASRVPVIPDHTNEPTYTPPTPTPPRSNNPPYHGPGPLPTHQPYVLPQTQRHLSGVPGSPAASPSAGPSRLPVTRSSALHLHPPQPGEVEKILRDLKSETSHKTMSLFRLSTMEPDSHREEVVALIRPMIKPNAGLANGGIQQQALRALGTWGDDKDVPMLVELGSGNDFFDKIYAVDALVALRSAPAARGLLTVAGANEEQRNTVETKLADMGSIAEPALIEALKSPKSRIRLTACAVLRKVGTAQCIEPLRTAAKDADAAFAAEVEQTISAVEARIATP